MRPSGLSVLEIFFSYVGIRQFPDPNLTQKEKLSCSFSELNFPVPPASPPPVTMAMGRR